MASVAVLTLHRPGKRVLEDPLRPSLALPPASYTSASANLMSSSSPSVDSGDDHTGHLKSLKSPDVTIPPTEESGPPVRRRRLSRSYKKKGHKSRVSAPRKSIVLAPPRSPVSAELLPFVDTHDSVSPVFTPEIPRGCRGVQEFANPFEDHFELEHKGKVRRLEGKNYPLVLGGVNGYIKLTSRLKVSNVFEVAKPQPVPVNTCNGGTASSRRQREAFLGWIERSKIPEGLKWFDTLTHIDKNLFEFYVAAWCSGRTVLKKTNTWLRDIAQMIHQDTCVKHAILALAGTYVFDYIHNAAIKQAAENHYRLAVIHLGLSLSSIRQHPPSDGDAEALVSAIALLNMNDVVSPEHWREREERPRWLDGARLACKVLDMTDPGFRYRDARNIQPSDARIGNAVIASRTAILALPMMPLELRNTEHNQFVWLLQGPEQNTKRIHGGCGMSPLLLYHFSQITHVAALVLENPLDCEFLAAPLASRMLRELQGLRQWYEKEHGTTGDITQISINVETIRDLLRSGHLDSRGSINTTDGMTASTAEAWRLAAIIYLQCRLLRLPRNHPEVLKQACNLAETIRVMPTSGYFFTAQAPFFPVFLLGVVAVLEEHGECAMKWFESVIKTECRSSVPPAYGALVEIRQWMSANIKDAPLPGPDRISDRYAWWEHVVDHVGQTMTTLCLV